MRMSKKQFKTGAANFRDRMRDLKAMSHVERVKEWNRIFPGLKVDENSRIEDLLYSLIDDAFSRAFPPDWFLM